MSSNRKNFNKFKEDYNNQYNLKKKELENSYESKNINNKKKSKDNNIEIEFSNNNIVKIELRYLTKYPYSKLASYFNSLNNIPKRNNHIFIDRNYNTFMQLLEFIKTEKIPKFNNQYEKNNFFDELNYWGIKLKIDKIDNLIFDTNFCPNFFTIKNNNILHKKNSSRGIVLLKRQLNLNNPFIEFYISLDNLYSHNKIYLGLIDLKTFKPKYLNSSFDKDVPFIFLWDIFGNKLFRRNGEKIKTLDLNKSCKCYLNFQVNKFGLKYDHLENSIELFRNDINLGVIVKNIPPLLTPAIEINVENCKIQLLNNNIQEEKIFI